KYLLVEIGTNAPGEIAHLARIVEPDIAVLTSIGRSHLEKLGSVEAVAKEKASLLKYLREGALAVVNADAPALRPMLRIAPAMITFGTSDDADLRLTDRGHDDDGWWLQVNDRVRFRLALPGRHNAMNALAAIAVARRLGVSDKNISDGLASAEAAPM